MGDFSHGLQGSTWDRGTKTPDQFEKAGSMHENATKQQECVGLDKVPTAVDEE